MRTDEPTVNKVIWAIKKLNNGRATGSDGIAPEVLKCARGPVSRDLYSVFIQLWRSGIVPADWQESITITLHKGKGHQTLCITTDNYSTVGTWHGFHPCFAGTHTTCCRPVSSSSAIRLYRSGFLADQPLTPFSFCNSCKSCQSYIVNLTDQWTLHSWTLSLLSTPSTALPSGKHFAAKACLTSYSVWSLPFMRTLVHVSGSDRNCRREFPPPVVSDRVAS